VKRGVEAEFADRLALELNLLEDCNISGVEVLGALAVAGLKLVVDEGEEASVAYDEAAPEA
jgi:hypothetical protein